jgi:hypothetical protein
MTIDLPIIECSCGTAFGATRAGAVGWSSAKEGFAGCGLLALTGCDVLLSLDFHIHFCPFHFTAETQVFRNSRPDHAQYRSAELQQQ